MKLKWIALIAWVFIWTCMGLRWAFGGPADRPMAWRPGGIVCSDMATNPLCQDKEWPRIDPVPRNVLRADSARSFSTLARVSEPPSQRPTEGTTPSIRLELDGSKLEVITREMKYIFRVMDGRIVLESVGAL